MAETESEDGTLLDASLADLNTSDGRARSGEIELHGMPHPTSNGAPTSRFKAPPKTIQIQTNLAIEGGRMGGA